MDTKMKILIAYDGSEDSAKMIEELNIIGLPKIAEVIVFTVAECWLPPPTSYGLVETDYASYYPNNINLALSIAEHARQSIQAIFPDWHLTAEASIGSPSREIIKRTDEWQPDLIIVGSQGLSALGRFVFGSVSHQIVNEAHCSVHIARSQTKKAVNAPVKIVIGIDGSDHAIAAVQAVANRHWPDGSEVKFVTAIGSAIVDASITQAAHQAGINVAHKSTANKAYLDEIQQMLQMKLTTLLEKTGLKTSFLVKEGNPKHLLINEAKEWGADIIFVGSRGLNKAKRFLLGSVSSAVAVRAQCSVEVIR